jgi:hypothetical protein
VAIAAKKLARRAIPIALVAALATAPALPAAAWAAPPGTTSAVKTEPKVTVHSLQDEIAKSVAKSLSQKGWKQDLTASVLKKDGVDLVAATAAPGVAAGLRSTVLTANAEILVQKGLPANTGSLVRLHLAHPSMAAALKAGKAPLVAATVPDDKPSPTIVAYDSSGAVVRLSADKVPDRPVLVVDIDVRKAMGVGLEMVDKALLKAGLAFDDVELPTPLPQITATLGPWPSSSPTPSPSPQAGVDTTKIVEARLSDDKETWIKGDAEIYTIVGGFGHDSKVKIDIVKMPWLNEEDTTYSPNQILIWWNQYKFNAVDAVMMEDDGDTNYQNLALALVAALAKIKPELEKYKPVVDEIIKAIPADWWTDDPDEVEQWYTIQKGTNGKINGASGNGWLKVQPFKVDNL